MTELSAEFQKLKDLVDHQFELENKLIEKHKQAQATADRRLSLLKVAYGAIKSLDIGALGTGYISETGEPYPIRDEVLHNIAKELADEDK